jgi:hypothetical protein
MTQHLDLKRIAGSVASVIKGLPEDQKENYWSTVKNHWSLSPDQLSIVRGKVLEISLSGKDSVSAPLIQSQDQNYSGQNSSGFTGQVPHGKNSPKSYQAPPVQFGYQPFSWKNSAFANWLDSDGIPHYKLAKNMLEHSRTCCGNTTLKTQIANFRLELAKDIYLNQDQKKIIQKYLEKNLNLFCFKISGCIILMIGIIAIIVTVVLIFTIGLFIYIVGVGVFIFVVGLLFTVYGCVKESLFKSKVRKLEKWYEEKSKEMCNIV